MAHESGGRATWRGPAAAILLALVIIVLMHDVFPHLQAEFRLRKADAQVASNPSRALVSLEVDAGSVDLSPRQKKTAGRIARSALDLAAGDRPLLKKIGWRDYDPSSPNQEYVAGSKSITLIFEIPPTLKAFAPSIRVSNAGQPLCDVRISEDGASGVGDVPLRAGGSLVADVDLICVIRGYGEVTEPIARGLRLVQSTLGPIVRLRAGERLCDLPEGKVTDIKVDRGTRLSVELSDVRGLSELRWSLEGTAHEPASWSGDPGGTARSVELPAQLTAAPANFRLLEFRASNTSRLITRASARLSVRDPAAPIIASAAIDGHPIADGAVVDAWENTLKLAVVLATGEDVADVGVLWDDRPLRCQVDGQEVTAALDSESEGTRLLVVQIGGVPAVRARIRFDRSPPVVTAVLDPGTFARDLEVHRAVHDAPVGAIVATTIADDFGLDRGSIEWVPEGAALEALEDPEPESRDGDLRAWTRRVRCAEPGEGRLRVSGSDRAGNRTTIHEFRFRVADPMADRVVTVRGRSFPGSRPIPCPDPRITVVTEGGIDLDGLAFSVLDPDHANEVLAQTMLARSDKQRVRHGTLDLSGVKASGKVVVGVLSRNGKELAKGHLVVDFQPPTFHLKDLTEAGGVDPVRYYAEPGQRISVVVSDDVAVDAASIEVKGATIDRTVGSSDISVTMALPEFFEDPIVVRATDEAGNAAEFRFEVVLRGGVESREAVEPPHGAESRARPPAPRGSPDGGPPLPEQKQTLADVQGTRRIVHPLLGTFLLVPTEDADGPFYLGEREVLVKEWRAFVAQITTRSANPAGGLAKAAAAALNYNTERLKNGEEEPAAIPAADLVRAYVQWANDVGKEQGVWRVPTVAQWQLAAGRALHPMTVYPTTASHPAGDDLTNFGSGGALFGRAFLTAREMPKLVLLPGAFDLKGMPGSLYEWVIDESGVRARLRLVGGSAFSPKEACRLDAAPKINGVENYERGVRLALFPARR